MMSHFRRVLLSFFVLAVAASGALGQTVQLKDGRALTGKVAATAGIAEIPDQPSAQAGETPTRPILVIDDELRRVFVPKLQAAAVIDAAPETLVKITPWQNPSRGSATLVQVGPALGIGPWDE